MWMCFGKLNSHGILLPLGWFQLAGQFNCHGTKCNFYPQKSWTSLLISLIRVSAVSSNLWKLIQSNMYCNTKAAPESCLELDIISRFMISDFQWKTAIFQQKVTFPMDLACVIFLFPLCSCFSHFHINLLLPSSPWCLFHPSPRVSNYYKTQLSGELFQAHFVVPHWTDIDNKLLMAGHEVCVN